MSVKLKFSLSFAATFRYNALAVQIVKRLHAPICVQSDRNAQQDKPVPLKDGVSSLKQSQLHAGQQGTRSNFRVYHRGPRTCEVCRTLHEPLWETCNVAQMLFHLIFLAREFSLLTSAFDPCFVFLVATGFFGLGFFSTSLAQVVKT